MIDFKLADIKLESSVAYLLDLLILLVVFPNSSVFKLTKTIQLVAGMIC